MDITLKDVNETLVLNDAVFASEYHEGLIHQLVTSYMNNARQGSKAQKSRAEVSGGGAKPWRQKGTGRARAGSIRSPIWRKGGTTFAAKPRSYEQKINRKMYRSGMRKMLSELLRQEKVHFVKTFALDDHKTKSLLAKLNDMAVHDVLIITNEVSENLYFASRNLYHVDILDAQGLNPVSLLNHKHIIITEDAVKHIEEVLA